jgi:polyhydroxyalkanoate synthase subunit PhaC
MQAAGRPITAASTPPQPHTPGSHERRHSPWLGCAQPPSDLATRYRPLDRWLMSAMADATGGVSPATVAAALADWWTHLAASPSKQIELAHLAASQALQFWTNVATPQAPCDAHIALPQDKRFADEAWNQMPWALARRAFLMAQQRWSAATSGVPGVERRHEEWVAFAARQWLDMLSPSNGLLSNPVVLARTRREGGANLLRGAAHAWEDAWRDALHAPPAGTERFMVGRDIAATPGDVVLRNRLIELIRYRPATRRVRPEPLLLVPAWIMKYYILDLSPHNSLVRWLIARGHAVYAISWKNPGPEDRDLGLDDYIRLGVYAALDAIAHEHPGVHVHAAGYCLGGTLLAAAAAALGREPGAQPLATMTLLAAQTDFTEPGELSLFIDEGQVNFLENAMWRRGYLDDRQMRRTFQMLRSADLIWSYRVINHLLGERTAASDLMAWNADGTRLPYRMHSQYLRDLFLNNALANGGFRVEGRPVNLDDVRVPLFNVGTVQDHVAPWRSVYKLHALTDAEQTFVLSAGGHNVGIVNPPGDLRSSYRLRTQHSGEHHLTPDEWLAATEPVAGSWWTAWGRWLDAHSGAMRSPGAAHERLRSLGPAPGSYVFQR